MFGSGSKRAKTRRETGLGEFTVVIGGRAGTEASGDAAVLRCWGWRRTSRRGTETGRRKA